MPYGVCKICGCTDNDPCYNPMHGNCWWVDDTHELCSHCAEKEIANDKRTRHCINTSDHHLQSAAEVLVCKNCEHWTKDKDSSDVMDEAAFGNCTENEWGSYGSDPMCMNFDERRTER